MPLPSSINDLSTTAGSNSPAGSESPSLIDDYLRTYASYIALLRDAAQSNAFNYAAAGGSGNAITATYSPAITTLTDSTVLLLKAAALNTGATTFSPNGLTAKPVVDMSHTALQGGEIVANGDVCLQYNTSVGGGSWVLIYSSGVAVQPPTVVGSARNVRMSVTVASASATLTADEIIVKSALGSYSRVLSSFSKTINLATTGAGGMDTGTAPVSGFVAIYAIYNPSTATSALLAVNATAAAVSNIYGGANMPAGYTASALLSVWPTTSGSLLVIGSQADRDFSIVPVTALSTNSTQASITALSISSAVPKNAITASGYNIMSSTTITATVGGVLGGSTTSVGQQSIGGIGQSCMSFKIPMITTQTLYYSSVNTAGTFNQTIAINGYSI